MQRLITIVLALLLSNASFAQDMTERESKFAELLTGAKLVGFFSLEDQGSELSEDSYTIVSTKKLDDDRWKFTVMIEFGGRNMPMAIKLPVHWAGDTPVITVDDLNFPGLGRYSARVMFLGDRYSGIWNGEGHAGEMFGRVERAELEATPPSITTGVGPEPTVNWPSFRGKFARGISHGFELPQQWNLETGENVLWRVALPGLAHSSPAVWGNDLFVTTAVRLDGKQDLKVGLYGSISPIDDPSEFRFELHCIDKRTGTTRWSRVAWQGVPDVKRHPKSSHAVPSPTTDGERVVAFFGSEGLHAFNMDGDPLWSKDLGRMDSGYFKVPDAQWGFGSSPVLHGDRVYVQCDVQENSFLACIDANDGEFIWKTEREDVPTWSTPTLDLRAGRAQVICNGWKHIGGYDLETGAELWRLEGGGDIPVPTPVVADGLILITNAHGGSAPIYAIEWGAEGTLVPGEEDNGIVWNRGKRGNYMQTPIALGGAAYFCNDAGILASYDLKTGEERYRERLGSGRTGFSASGVGGDGKLYFASEEGDVHVIRAGEYEQLSVNSLGEECMSTPAISEGVLYYRTRGHLFAFGIEGEK